ncbi:MAG: ROK family transcriptional regulator [Lachnospiraceae bacterium]|nr:ROK family transcriptional regulator [Lachnospiraceae bacterium]
MAKNSEIASEMNRAAILELLRTQGPLSKADMKRILDISFPAVTYNVKKLMEDNLIYECGEADNAIGRKATLLAFNSRKAYLVGVDLGRQNIRTMCADIAGNILQYHTVKIGTGGVFEQVIERIYEIVKATGITIEDVACIGIGIPGIYDTSTDSHKLAPFVEGWGEGSLMQRLKQEFSMEIYIENSVNLGAVGERWQGIAKGYDEIAYVDFGVGFGSALIKGGELVRGNNGAFGEVGFMVLQKDRLLREYSDEGALEKLIPSSKIANVIDRYFKKESEISIKKVFEFIKEQNMEMELEDIPSYFAMALVNIAVMTNPEVLVISGRLGCAIYRDYKDYIDKVMRGNVPFPPKLLVTELAERANVIGAIAVSMIHSNSKYTNFREFK